MKNLSLLFLTIVCVFFLESCTSSDQRVVSTDGQSDNAAAGETVSESAAEETEVAESVQQQNESTPGDGSSGNNQAASEIVYEGTVTDSQSGYSQDYIMYLRPDLSAASIAGGPFYPVEDQGDGSYMWLDGTIIGMSFRPMQDRCVIYDSDGNYFCTLYRSR